MSESSEFNQVCILSLIIFNRRETGYYGVFSISAILLTIGLVHGFYRVKEAEREVSDAGEVKSLEKLKRMDLIWDWFNIKRLHSILEVISRPRKDKKRVMLFLCFMLIFFGWGPSSGKQDRRDLLDNHMD